MSLCLAWNESTLLLSIPRRRFTNRVSFPSTHSPSDMFNLSKSWETSCIVHLSSSEAGRLRQWRSLCLLNSIKARLFPRRSLICRLSCRKTYIWAHIRCLNRPLTVGRWIFKVLDNESESCEITFIIAHYYTWYINSPANEIIIWKYFLRINVIRILILFDGSYNCLCTDKISCNHDYRVSNEIYWFVFVLS